MAQYAHDSGQGGGPFGYHSEWLQGSGSAAYNGSEDNFFHQQAILNQSDNALMQNFFDNPDAAAMNESFFSPTSFNWAGADQKLNGDGYSNLSGFAGDVQTIQNPAVTLGAMSNSHFQTHSSELRTHGLPGPEASSFGGQDSQASEEDVKAAAYIYNLANGQDSSRSAQIFGAGSSWGNLDVMQSINSPLTSSGRQSANSNAQSQHQTMANNPFQPGQSQNQLLHQQYLQQQLANSQRVRHGSLQVDTAGFHQPSQIHMPNSAHVHAQTNRPHLARFGSDPDFQNYYQAPNSHLSIEHEKSANLNNVPFAAQAAANGQPHVSVFTSSLPRPNYQHHQTSPASYLYQPGSANSASMAIGGLHLRSPTATGMLPHGHPPAKMTHQDTEDYDEEESDGSEFAEEQPRKRRKSQMDRDDNAEFTPSTMKAPALKRPTKIDVSDDDVYTPSTAKAGTKRRKSNATARQSLASSSQSNSPIAMTSPTGIPASGTKKKSRGSIARQNLTEDEKRRNHILSEKTRRDLIKVQYDQLDSLVPALKNGKSGLSRSDILKEIVSYVEEVVAGNTELERRLEDAEALDDDDDDVGGDG